MKQKIINPLKNTKLILKIVRDFDKLDKVFLNVILVNANKKTKISRKLISNSLIIFS